MNAKADVLKFPSSLRSWQHIAIFLFACAVLIARKPDAVFHAQFYGEDGHRIVGWDGRQSSEAKCCLVMRELNRLTGFEDTESTLAWTPPMATTVAGW